MNLRLNSGISQTTKLQSSMLPLESPCPASHTTTTYIQAKDHRNNFFFLATKFGLVVGRCIVPKLFSQAQRMSAMSDRLIDIPLSCTAVLSCTCELVRIFISGRRSTKLPTYRGIYNTIRGKSTMMAKMPAPLNWTSNHETSNKGDC